MNDSPQPPESGATPTEENSVWSRLANVVATPGEVFHEVKSSPPRTANWLLPLLLAIAVGWVGGWLVMSDPVVQQQIQDLQAAGLQKQAEKQGLSAAQIDQQRTAAEKFGRIFREFATWVGPVLANLVILFWWALLTWLLGTKALHGQFGFGKALEASGLILIPGILHGIVVTLLILVFGSVYAGTHLALPLVRQFDPAKPLHTVLASVDVVAIWIVTIRTTAVAQLSGTTWRRAAAWVFGLWVTGKLFILGIGLLWMRLFGG